MTPPYLLAQGKPLPSEMEAIVNQILGIVTWAGIIACFTSLLALVILLAATSKTTNIDRYVSGTGVIMVCAGVVGSAAGVSNWLLG